jgi:polysaccharide deacetylase family protein (PEP-CTERM system associated)
MKPGGSHRPRAIVTFDVEDWFQTENLRTVCPRSSWEDMPRRVGAATRVVLGLLGEYHIRATFFVLGWVAEREPALVREIAQNGHEVACHGYGHVLAMHMTRREFQEDVARARELLAEISGQSVIGYRAPSFNIRGDELRTLAACGFRYDSSLHPFTLHDRYTPLPECGRHLRPGVSVMTDSIVELALPVERVGPLQVPIAGGAYFRLFPPSWFRRLVRRALTRDGHYVMYLHTWEFDPGQPRIHGAGIIRAFRHYNHLSHTHARMTQLIRMLKGLGTEFVTAREFVDAVAPIV